MTEVMGFPAQPGRQGYVVLHRMTGEFDPETGREEREYDRYDLVRMCPLCREESRVVVPAQGLFEYEHGAFVQKAFPEMTPGEREQVMSGTHEACWDRYMRDPEEDDDQEPFVLADGPEGPGDPQ